MHKNYSSESDFPIFLQSINFQSKSLKELKATNVKEPKGLKRYECKSSYKVAMNYLREKIC